MKCVVDKKELSNAVSAVKKLNSKAVKIFFKVKKGVLSVITNNPIYMKYSIPVSESEDGTIAITAELFDKLLSLRKNKLTMSVASNTLKIEGGSEIKIYCLDIGDDDISIPEIKSNKGIKLSPESVGDLKSIFSKVSFNTLEPEELNVILCNNKNGYYIGMADGYHCAFYDSSKSISNDKFKLISKLSLLRDTINFIDGKALFEVSDQGLLIKSDTLVISIPGVQSTGVTFEDAREHIVDENFKKGICLLNKKNFMTIIKSLNIIGSGKDVLSIKVKDDVMLLGLESTHGKSKDRFKLNKNSLGKFEIECPIMALEDALTSLSEDKIEFRLSKNGDCYRLKCKTKKFVVTCICPLASSR